MHCATGSPTCVRPPPCSLEWPPSPALLRALGALGIEVVHVYGLTETYGPAALCDWRPEWDGRPEEERARLKARQGVANVVSQPLRIRAAGRDVPADGMTIGEIQLRGNNVMLGYYVGARRACQARIARFKAPRRVIFGDLPKTATGKIQKFKLRESGLDDRGEEAPPEMEPSST